MPAVEKLDGYPASGGFPGITGGIGAGGKQVLSTEWFEASTNVYKIPQYVVDVCDLLPGTFMQSCPTG